MKKIFLYLLVFLSLGCTAQRHHFHYNYQLHQDTLLDGDVVKIDLRNKGCISSDRRGNKFVYQFSDQNFRKFEHLIEDYHKHIEKKSISVCGFRYQLLVEISSKHKITSCTAKILDVTSLKTKKSLSQEKGVLFRGGLIGNYKNSHSCYHIMDFDLESIIEDVMVSSHIDIEYETVGKKSYSKKIKFSPDTVETNSNDFVDVIMSI